MNWQRPGAEIRKSPTMTGEGRECRSRPAKAIGPESQGLASPLREELPELSVGIDLSACDWHPVPSPLVGDSALRVGEFSGYDQNEHSRDKLWAIEFCNQGLPLDPIKRAKYCH